MKDLCPPRAAAKAIKWRQSTFALPFKAVRNWLEVVGISPIRLIKLMSEALAKDAGYAPVMTDVGPSCLPSMRKVWDSRYGKGGQGMDEESMVLASYR